MEADKKKLYKIINEAVRNAFDSFLNEGIDFDYDTMTVSYNPYHENNVDTSLENNPSKDDNIVKGVSVWSIFKRKKGVRGDGNPLVYALKGENWSFRSEKDRVAIEQRFDEIASKFAKMYPIGITILIPSGNSLNRHIADVVMSKSKDAKLLEGAICKLTVKEVEDIVLAKDSTFRKYYGNDFASAYKQLCIYFDNMDEQRDGTFSRHLVKDKKMRDVLLNTLKITNDRCAKDSKVINGNNILIIDDTISRGQSIIEACKILKDSYSPKSITVLTLLSKLY